MFKPSEKCSTNRDIPKRVYIRYSPSEISTINTPNSQVYINIPRAIWLKNGAALLQLVGLQW